MRSCNGHEDSMVVIFDNQVEGLLVVNAFNLFEVLYNKMYLVSLNYIISLQFQLKNLVTINSSLKCKYGDKSPLIDVHQSS